MASIRTPIERAALTAVLTAAAFSAAASGAQTEFAYHGETGPGFWGELDETWSACAPSEAAWQSPIDISRATVDPALGRLDLKTHSTTINLTNNGHTLQQAYSDTASYIRFEDRSYALQQFHFHTYAEHRIAGRQPPMEMHAVYSSDDQSALLVVGQTYEIGDANPFLQKLIGAGLPEGNGDSTVDPSIQINVAEAWPNTRMYYTYPGSLTTPPCSETVTWVVLDVSARMSLVQYEAFRSILGNNFRPLQPLNGRKVRASPGGQVIR
jgi:carbonic anhydrase